MIDTGTEVAPPGVDARRGGGYELVPVTPAEWPAARELLSACFPRTPAGWWDRGFDRLQTVPAVSADEPLGVLMLRGVEAVGISLMLPSRRPAAQPGGAPRRVVNASSWAITPRARQQALWMARHAMADPGTTYTALTPIFSAARLLQRIGFKPSSHQTLLVATPRLLRGAGAGRHVLDGRAALRQLADHALAQAFEDHLRLGCRLSAVDTADGWLPLVWRDLRRLRGLRTAELVYAPDQAAVVAHAGALARHLLARGYLLMQFEGHENLQAELPCTRLFQRRFVRGPHAPQGIDHLYSELVYLHR